MTTTLPAVAPIASDDPRWSFEPGSLTELFDVAERLAKSSAVPAGPTDAPQYKGAPGNIIAAAMLGRNVGFGVMQSVLAFYIVNGRPSLWGDAPLALVRSSGLLEWLEEEDRPELAGGTAVCRLRRRGDPTVYELTFSHEQAVKAGWTSRNRSQWLTIPKRMRQLRCRGWLLRDVFGDVLKGIAIREEQEDALDVTPVPPAEVAGDVGVVVPGGGVLLMPTRASDVARITPTEAPPPSTAEESTPGNAVGSVSQVEPGPETVAPDEKADASASPSPAENDPAGLEEYPRISKAQAGMLRATLKRGKKTDAEYHEWLRAHVATPAGAFAVLHTKDIPMAVLDKVLRWAQGR